MKHYLKFRYVHIIILKKGLKADVTFDLTIKPYTMTKERQIIECVPNFSEGRDMNVIRQITAEIEAVEGVRLLDVDPGEEIGRAHV